MYNLVGFNFLIFNLVFALFSRSKAEIKDLNSFTESHEPNKSRLPIKIRKLQTLLQNTESNISGERKGENVLLIGDSIDRFTVQDWCTLQQRLGRNVTGWKWGSGVIKYGSNEKQPALACHSFTSGDTISSLHVFGSRPYGPYLWVNGKGDPFTDTTKRIAEASRLYKEQLGMPTKVFFNSVQWDLRPYEVKGLITNTDPNWSGTFEVFKNDFYDRLREIRNIFPVNSTLLGIRTAMHDTKITQGMDSAYNDLLRYIAVTHPELSLQVYDLDFDGWSIVSFNDSRYKEVLRYEVHPNQHIAAAAAQKILGRQYTQHILEQRPLTAESNNSLLVSLDAGKAIAHMRSTNYSDFYRLFKSLHHSPLKTLSCKSDIDLKLLSIVSTKEEADHILHHNSLLRKQFYAENSFESAKLNDQLSKRLFFTKCSSNEIRFAWMVEDPESLMKVLKLGYPGDVFPITVEDFKLLIKPAISVSSGRELFIPGNATACMASADRKCVFIVLSSNSSVESAEDIYIYFGTGGGMRQVNRADNQTSTYDILLGLEVQPPDQIFYIRDWHLGVENEAALSLVTLLTAPMLQSRLADHLESILVPVPQLGKVADWSSLFDPDKV